MQRVHPVQRTLSVGERQFADQLSGVDVKAAGDTNDRLKTQTALPTFHFAELRPMYAAESRGGLLAEPQLKPASVNPLAELFGGSIQGGSFGFGVRHA